MLASSQAGLRTFLEAEQDTVHEGDCGVVGEGGVVQQAQQSRGHLLQATLHRSLGGSRLEQGQARNKSGGVV